MKNQIPALLLFCAALAAASPAAVQAQSSNSPAVRPMPLARRLALTHDQQIQFRAINRERKQQVAAIQADASLSPHVKHEKIKEIHATSENKIRGILNQNQLDEYEQIKRERRQKAVDLRDTSIPQ